MKIVSGVHLIDGTMANCYFIENDGDGILVDTGMAGSAKKISAFVRENSFALKTVLITHYHPDHVGGLNRISEEFHPDIFVPDKEVDVVMGKRKPETSGTFMSKLVGAMAHPKPVMNVRPVSEFKSDNIEAIDTFGHTPGSTSYLLKKQNIILVGDAVVNSKGSLQINKGFTLDFEEAKRSQQKIMEKGAEIILSGHGDPFYVNKKSE